MLVDINAQNLGRSALFSMRRFDEPGLGIEATPSFAIAPTDKVYGIGSCFSQAVAHTLSDLGHDMSFGGLCHGHNPLNILRTLRWGLDEGRSFGEEHLARLDDGCWFDPHGLEFTRE